MDLSTIKKEWLGNSNIKNNVLSGMVVTFAILPEAIAFSIIAGVDPMVGLYTAFCLTVVIAFVGGRPGMISSAAGSTALLMTTLVADHGLEYLLAATILTGIIQLLMGVLKVAKFMKYIPRSVMAGFVNALAILIFAAQLPHFAGESWPMYALVAGTLAIIYLLPRFSKAIPAPLIAILVISLIAVFTSVDTRTVGDMGELTQTLPVFLFPDIPLSLETLMIIFPYSLALAIVGLLESFLTAQIVDDMTNTDSNKNREAKGQGTANIIAGFFGGMAGCALIGQSVTNVKSGGRGRLSTLTAGVFTIVLIVLLNDLLVQIPMAALVGLMFMISFNTFDWSSLKSLHLISKTDATVMIVTVFTVVITHDLSKGVLVGVILSAIFFVAKASKIRVTSFVIMEGKKKIYHVEGQLFFASVSDFVSAFQFKQNIHEVDLDLSAAQIWDDSAVGAIDKIVLKFNENGIKVNIIGLNENSSTLIKKELFTIKQIEN
ncbi:SulP family inorganic anion transporter [Bacillus sp. 37MA]|uniref:SulP family inorganic anion transporter n=1 Tax=Bacillus sp. 37MA TaxID=1132442 RepID=UPI000360254C|nr:SulP family inorganic anion transporter [Bacillus sp. 37MA]